MQQHLAYELPTDDQPCVNGISTPTPLSPTSPPSLPDKLLYDNVHELSTDEQRCVNTTSIPSSSPQEHAPTLQSSPLSILIPPDKLNPSLSCWIKNMNKLSSLIDRLQELASSAPAEHQSQLLRQVVALRATSEKQQDHFMEFLQLSEEYANKYLLNISAEIEQQSSFLDNLEERLEAARKLHGEAVDLQTLYESGIVASMKGLRATGKPVPCYLESQNTETFDVQNFHGHFHKTMLYSARWTLCWLRFNDFTRN